MILDIFASELLKIAMPLHRSPIRTIPSASPIKAVKAFASMRQGTASVASKVDPARAIRSTPALSTPVHSFRVS